MARLSISMLVLLFVSCSSSKNTLTPAEAMELEKILNNGQFEFEADWAHPRVTNSLIQLGNAGLLAPGNNAGRISLIGNPNYIRFDKDSISAFLPYYGENQMTTSYNGQDIAISFEEQLTDQVFVPNKKNTSYEVRFKGIDDAESYRVYITVFPNKTASVYITSSHRFPIAYTGRIKTIPLSKQETVFN